jgi:NADPH:quinone reductase-like Zn-dependent oxidoreductase
MRAVQMSGYGGPEVLTLGEAPKPEPGPGQVRVKAAAIGVNPADWKWRAGWFKDMIPFSFPHVPGYDVAGVVDAVGEGVVDLAAGDRVVGMTPPQLQGAYAEYVVVAAADTAKIPSSLDFATAAALPTPGLTGVQLVEEMIRPKPGETILVAGAVGGCGRFSLHAAKVLGARVVAGVRASQADEARALGADEVVVIGGPDWTGAPFDAVADTVGGPDVAKLCRHVKPGGIIGTVSTTPIDPTGLPAEPAFFAYHPDRKRLAELAELAAAGHFPVPVARRLPLARAGEAQMLVEKGGQGGKVVLEP